MKLIRVLLIVLSSAFVAPIVHAETPAEAAAAVHVFIEHQVADYATWRKAYDAFAPTQKKLGVTYQHVYQTVDDPNDVVVIHHFVTAEKAKAFLASAELKSAMEKSGVKGTPHISIAKAAN